MTIKKAFGSSDCPSTTSMTLNVSNEHNSTSRMRNSADDYCPYVKMANFFILLRLFSFHFSQVSRMVRKWLSNGEVSEITWAWQRAQQFLLLSLSFFCEMSCSWYFTLFLPFHQGDKFKRQECVLWSGLVWEFKRFMLENCDNLNS